MEENFKWREEFRFTSACGETMIPPIPGKYIYCPYCGGVLRRLYRSAFHKIPKYADIFVIKELGEDTDQWPFNDYDGHGYFATSTQESDISIDVGMFLLKNIPEWATHITWYNK